MMRILAINSGSSSLKFALYEIGATEECILTGAVSGVGWADGVFQIKEGDGRVLAEESLTVRDPRDAVGKLLRWLEAKDYSRDLEVVGHRMVHGGLHYRQPQVATPKLLGALQELSAIDPDHLPQAIAAVHAVQKSYPKVKQVLCFDTAFHRNMPAVAQTVALSKSLHEEGIVRYGFHGLSYEYILEQLGESASGNCIIIAHLGNGASMAAVKDGQSVETTMGFSPTGGLVMSTRCGDLDPAIVLYLLRKKGMNPAEVNEMVNKRAGLLGVSGLSSDMKELLEQEGQNPDAALAVDLFCYRAAKSVGALAAALGGLDRMIFTGGIGENAAAVRQRICAHLQFLGLHLDADRNTSGTSVISGDESPVTIQVMKTNEELMIARHSFRLVA